MPRVSVISSTSRAASASPARAASKTSLAAKSVPRRVQGVSGFSSSSFFIQRTTPVALEYCSRQPCLPQPQTAVSWGLTVMWPISPPAPCAPSVILPLTMTPPPTPVPSVTITALRQPLAQPIQISPSAATLASLPTSTLMPSSRPDSWMETFRSPQPPRLAQTMGTIRLSSTGPGTPTPTPSTCSAVMPFSCILSFTALARFPRMCSPALEVSVGTSHFSSRAPAVVNRPTLAVVPPRSMPNAYSFIFIYPFFAAVRPPIFSSLSL